MDVFKHQREKLGRICRAQWAEDSELDGLSECEKRALAIAAMDGRINEALNVSGSEIQEIIARAERAKKEWGLFQRAMLGEASLRLNEKRELLARISKARCKKPMAPVLES